MSLKRTIFMDGYFRKLLAFHTVIRLNPGLRDGQTTVPTDFKEF
jgi:hypothetical protein